MSGRLSLKAWLLIDVAVLSAIQAVLALVDGPTWLRILCAVAACVLAISQAVNDHKQTQKATSREEAKATERDLQQWNDRMASATITGWPPPIVSAVEPHETPARVRPWSGRTTTDPLPKYVPRDIDTRLDQQLQRIGRALVVETPLGGASRTVYELALRTNGRSTLIAPSHPDGLRVAVELDAIGQLPKNGIKLLWLSDIDEFSETGLTKEMLEGIVRTSPGLRIIATIRSGQPFAEWSSRSKSLAAYFDALFLVNRMPTPAELAAAKEAHPGVDFSSGIAPAFTFVSSLIDKMNAGNSGCRWPICLGDCLVSRSIVDVSLAWRATGTTRALREQLLTGLVSARTPVHPALDPEHVQTALDWAAEYNIEGKSLVDLQTTPAGERTITSQEQLALLWAEENVPQNAIWDAALDDAAAAGDVDAIGRMGYQAEIRGWVNLAPSAWDKLPPEDVLSEKWVKSAANFAHDVIHDGPRQVGLEERLLRCVEVTDADNSKIRSNLLRLGDAYMHADRPEAAADVLSRGIKLSETLKEDEIYCDLLKRMGEALHRLRRYEQSLEFYGRAAAVMADALHADAVMIAQLHAEMARPLTSSGQARRAISLLEAALPIIEQAHGADSMPTANVCDGLGCAWRALAQPSKSIGHSKRVVRIVERERGGRHPSLAEALNGYGLDLFELGRREDSRDALRRALRISSEARGPESVAVATAKLNLAVVLANLDETATALRLLSEARVVLVENFGENDESLIYVYNTFGSTMRLTGQLSAAIPHYSDALRIARQYSEPLQVVMCLSNLAQASAELGKREEAWSLFEEGIDLAHAEFDPDSTIMRFIIRCCRKSFPDLIVQDDGRIIRTGMQ